MLPLLREMATSQDPSHQVCDVCLDGVIESDAADSQGMLFWFISSHTRSLTYDDYYLLSSIVGWVHTWREAIKHFSIILSSIEPYKQKSAAEIEQYLQYCLVSSVCGHAQMDRSTSLLYRDFHNDFPKPNTQTCEVEDVFREKFIKEYIQANAPKTAPS